MLDNVGINVEYWKPMLNRLQLEEELRYSLVHHLGGRISDSLRRNLWNGLWENLWVGLGHSLMDSLRENREDSATETIRL
jgi:hypothetical protein